MRGERQGKYLQFPFSFIRDIHFSRMHVFKYSVRKGTAAAKMAGPIPEKKKQERSKVLLAIDREERSAYARSFLFEPVSVLFEERVVLDGRKYMKGYTREYVPVLLHTDEDLTNTIREVIPLNVTADGELILE